MNPQEEQKEENLQNIALKDVDFDIKDILIEKIENLYLQLKNENEEPKFRDLFQVDEIVDKFQQIEEQKLKEGAKENELTEFFKHSNQQNNIIELMNENKLILETQDNQKPYMYVEYGAGRAGLSSFVAAKLIQYKNLENMFLVVDRDTRRYKLDKEFKVQLKTFREKIDISDFDLKKFLNEKQDEIKKDLLLIAIAKHLCGGATDLAITSLSQQPLATLKGISIATCCHHCCDTRTYINLDYLKQHFTEQELQLLPRISSWAVSQRVKHRKRRVGFKVKRILDYGRCLFIQNALKMDIKVYQYCDPIKESPENILLLATNQIYV